MANRKLRLERFGDDFSLSALSIDAGYRDYSSYFRNEKFCSKRWILNFVQKDGKVDRVVRKLIQKEEKKFLSKSSLKFNKLSEINNIVISYFLRFSVFLENTQPARFF